MGQRNLLSSNWLKRLASRKYIESSDHQCARKLSQMEVQVTVLEFSHNYDLKYEQNSVISVPN